ncbi:hypothetical protein BDF14DRAFT_1857277, partial [Spinellus fusiger]
MSLLFACSCFFFLFFPCFPSLSENYRVGTTVAGSIMSESPPVTCLALVMPTTRLEVNLVSVSFHFLEWGGY